VTLGVVDITRGPHQWSDLVPPNDMIIHENYSDDGETAWNDVALLRIRKIVFFNGEFDLVGFHMVIMVYFNHFDHHQHHQLINF
jgi:hypothetical protein